MSEKVFKILISNILELIFYGNSTRFINEENEVNFLFRIWNKTKTLGPQMSKVSSKNMIFFKKLSKTTFKIEGGQ
jgi:hypothetical protein